MLNGDDRRRKGGLCQSCFVDTVTWLDSRAEKVPEDGIVYDEASGYLTCFACKAPSADGYCLFATDYASKAERRDWYGPLCEMCALGAATILEDGMPVSKQRPLTAS